MTVLKFHGIAEIKWIGGLRDKGDYEDQPCVGDDELIPAVEAAFKNGQQVTVAIGDERFTGDLDAWKGMCGWSEYTPADPAQLRVGPHNLIDIIDRLEGQEITVWIADEPINTLD